MLSRAYFILLDPLFVHHLAEFVSLFFHLNRILVGAITGMQPDLMAAIMNAAHQSAYARFIDAVMRIELRHRSIDQEIERDAVSRLFVDIHDPVERVVGVCGIITNP